MTFLTKTFWDLGYLWWQLKLEILISKAEGLIILHAKNLVHCELHNRNILMNYNFGLNDYAIVVMNLGLYKLENDLILNSYNKNNKISGSIPCIPPEVLRGNEFIGEDSMLEWSSNPSECLTAAELDPNLLLKPNESTTSGVNSHNINGETEIKSKQKSFQIFQP
ncbi:hypothetical protein Glove_155g65 [Diversispora epigaea]|uniref:Protein kinase domain-containing protein n=1 Tax=Diversispora epigaea TaxID=1348612 RepID=A0A397IWT3_9GLOM|nr:hypothetical protein Glove_155g65 [Diversispora epigaea]